MRHGGKWQVRGCLERWFIVIEPDPSHIDTSTLEYRLEVHRQWLLDNTVEVQGINGKWYEEDCPQWNWKDGVVFRVQPTGDDEHGNPYYLDGEEKVYLPR